MAYVIKIEATKPANIDWFSKSGQSAYATSVAIDNWNHSVEGFILSFGQNLSIDNVYRHVVVFDTQINGDAWLAAKVTQPNYVIRDAYFKANGITEVVTIYE